MMKYSIMLTAFVLFLVGVAGPAPAEALSARLNVVVSIAPYAYVVERIGGDYVSVEALVQPGQDPHTFAPAPRQLISLGKARIFFTAGLPFESRLSKKIRKTYPALWIVDLSAGMDAGNETADPHIWLSPPLLKIVAENIARELEKADPVHAEVFRRNFEAFSGDLDAVNARIKARLLPYQGRSFYVFHPALGRFAKTYGLRQEAVETDGKAPTPKQLVMLIGKARAERIRIIFAEPQFDRRSADVIAKSINGEVVFFDPLSKDVLKNLEYIASKIDNALRPVDY